MKWEEIRNQYPDSWVLVEALKAESKDNRREIEEMSVISEFNNSVEAWKGYKYLHLKDRSRELYIFHTCNKDIEVIEEQFTGVRSRRYQ
ncbi:hypothetical protein [Caldalkalibacillus salinus]|uniref:hypothetical protein n=1 Tax=Caldalkalibacillus salinus TaxID=2803787 RepID=UPI00192315FD|nr:hypothetical protein [Caldalkalibacillus salinus]